MVIEIAPVLQPTTTSNNKNFNAIFFFNEQCKDAMNMTEFIETLQLILEDMTKIGKQGQSIGMTNVRNRGRLSGTYNLCVHTLHTAVNVSVYAHFSVLLPISRCCHRFFSPLQSLYNR